ncbi:stage V sporulation T C-terminal domain-containing protein [Paenibacillus lutrae]|uniref:AbrB/MazE/SpoVT family DNA-binding domain-containing protein n=1 Tax=Paenibacillus lutrae TaxID=2078573 RepID=A0A7X3FLZ6_9BACL|nr:stage V sporulation T C-terminal domain-containing protein [Paenibacillus lutrae]MVP02186.1 AbrB/MazE/SpoVT family DNA-binding domain-containing protein [Paenibacillus lutrae]
MKATGIVRRIDDLGRVVIPKEIRRTMRIKEGDPMEIFVNPDGEVILQKYSPVGELGDFAVEYAESLSESTNHQALICDRETFIAAAGRGRKEMIGKRVGDLVDRVMNKQEVTLQKTSGSFEICGGSADTYSSFVIAPIVNGGESGGAVLLLSKEEGVVMGETERAMVEMAASFLAKQTQL